MVFGFRTKSVKYVLDDDLRCYFDVIFSFRAWPYVSGGCFLMWLTKFLYPVRVTLRFFHKQKNMLLGQTHAEWNINLEFSYLEGSF